MSMCEREECSFMLVAVEARAPDLMREYLAARAAREAAGREASDYAEGGDHAFAAAPRRRFLGARRRGASLM